MEMEGEEEAGTRRYEESLDLPEASQLGFGSRVGSKQGVL